MLRFSLTAEAEERLESLRERMANRGMEMEIENVLEMVIDMGLRQAERAADALVAFDPGEEE
ncbi:MAG: hypothetical protein K6U04_05595 [Armatimonadetes bacterium]|nr:hypothetical protein [Armatimonadota bacterium]